MIQLNDLRIGNYVQEDVLGIVPVTEIGKGVWVAARGFDINKQPTTVYYHLNLSSINPIPLTPSILEKAGFEWSESEERYMLVIDDVLFDSFGDSVQANRNASFVTPIGKLVKYLHSLMNLYHALTGNELKIEL